MSAETRPAEGAGSIDSLRDRLDAIGQAHLLAGWDSLDADQKKRLAAQIEALDLDSIPGLVSSYVTGARAEQRPARIEPAPFLPLDPGSKGHPWDAGAARSAGESLIGDGKVACFTVAGGQGSRLGFDGPKGCFRGGAISGKSLFQVFGEGILASNRKYQTQIPWYIMTSPLNDGATRTFFDEMGYFGLDRSHVVFLAQRVMPSFEIESGRMMLADPATVATNPDGHGGSFRALVESGATADMTARGVEHVSYFQVDNPLAKIVDPVFLGLHAVGEGSSGEMSSKMIAKREPHEPVGVFCVGDGRLGMIEYSDMEKHCPELVDARNGEGGLVLGAGNPAIHAMSVAFIERVHNDPDVALPFHRAIKAVAHVDPATGEPVVQSEKNAVKLERFVFDALASARDSVILETDRVEEFGPIKNAKGNDSPASCAALQTERGARWLESVGFEVPRREDGSPDCTIEISPLTALEASDLGGACLPSTIERGALILI